MGFFNKRQPRLSDQAKIIHADLEIKDLNMYMQAHKELFGTYPTLKMSEKTQAGYKHSVWAPISCDPWPVLIDNDMDYGEIIIG